MPGGRQTLAPTRARGGCLERAGPRGVRRRSDRRTAARAGAAGRGPSRRSAPARRPGSPLPSPCLRRRRSGDRPSRGSPRSGTSSRRSASVRSPEARIATQLARRPIRVDARGRSSPAPGREAPPRPASNPGDPITLQARTTNSANPSRSAGGARQQRRQRLRVRLAHRPVPGGRHDRRQRQHPLRMPDRQRLGDHPALRGAHQVRRLDARGDPAGPRSRPPCRRACSSPSSCPRRRPPSRPRAARPRSSSSAPRRGCRTARRGTRAPASSSQNSSSQPSICTPSPMISSIVGSAGSPNAS